MCLTIAGVIVMSDMPGLLFSMREGNGGVMPLSHVKIDSKFWLSRLASIPVWLNIEIMNGCALFE